MNRYGTPTWMWGLKRGGRGEEEEIQNPELLISNGKDESQGHRK